MTLETGTRTVTEHMHIRYERANARIWTVPSHKMKPVKQQSDKWSIWIYVHLHLTWSLFIAVQDEARRRFASQPFLAHVVCALISDAHIRLVKFKLNKHMGNWNGIGVDIKCLQCFFFFSYASLSCIEVLKFHTAQMSSVNNWMGHTQPHTWTRTLVRIK